MRQYILFTILNKNICINHIIIYSLAIFILHGIHFLQVLFHLVLILAVCHARPGRDNWSHNGHHHKNGKTIGDLANRASKPRVGPPISGITMSPRVAFASRPPMNLPNALNHRESTAVHGANTPTFNVRSNHDSYKIHESDGPIKTQETKGKWENFNQPQRGKKTEDRENDESRNYTSTSHNRDSTARRTKRDSRSSHENAQSQLSEEEIRFAEPVCRSVSQWVVKSQSYDIWGNQVEIEQHIDINGQQMHQYFYETTCEKSQRDDGVAQHAACKGVDREMYRSVCRDEYSWVYAYVRGRHGEHGWSLVKMATSCGCALIERNPKQAFLDFLTTSSP